MKNIIIIIGIAYLIIGCCQGNADYMAMDLVAEDGQGGSLATFTLKGNYLYTVDNYDLNVFSLTNEEEPELVNTVRIGFNIETLFSFKDYLYIGSRNGMFIYSINEPEEPTMLSNVDHFTACDPVIANDTHAYVTLHSNAICGNNINVLEVYDIQNITQPVLISSHNLVSPKGMGFYENYLIVCDNEIKLYDITNPQQAQLITSIDKEAFDVIVSGDLLIAIGEEGVFQYELSLTQTGVGIEGLSEISTLPVM